MRLKLSFAAIAIAAMAVAALAWDWFTVLPADALATARYVGRATCAECHQAEHTLWQGSDHDRAMELATGESVLADFNDTSFSYHGVTTRFFRRGGKFIVPLPAVTVL